MTRPVARMAATVSAMRHALDVRHPADAAVSRLLGERNPALVEDAVRRLQQVQVVSQ